MGKSSGSKRHKAKKTKLQKPLQPQPQKWLLWKALLTRRAIVFELVGFVAALLAIWEVYFETVPEIHAPGAEYSSPFLLPFSVKNPSRFFAMYDVQWFCGINNIEIQGGGGAKGFSMTEPPITEINPGEIRNFRCRIGVESQIVNSASISLRVKFKTLFFERTSSWQPMTWAATANPPRWIEGEFVGPPTR